MWLGHARVLHLLCLGLRGRDRYQAGIATRGRDRYRAGPCCSSSAGLASAPPKYWGCIFLIVATNVHIVCEVLRVCLWCVIFRDVTSLTPAGSGRRARVGVRNTRFL